MIIFRDHTINELSFLIEEYGFDKPIRKNHDNKEFSFTWKKREIEVEIKWDMYVSRSAPFPKFKVNNPSIERPFKEILDNYSGCCYNKYHRHEKIRNKWIFKSSVNDRRNDILAELFRQRLDVFTRLLKKNDEYLLK